MPKLVLCVLLHTMYCGMASTIVLKHVIIIIHVKYKISQKCREIGFQPLHTINYDLKTTSR